MASGRRQPPYPKQQGTDTPLARFLQFVGVEKHIEPPARAIAALESARERANALRRGAVRERIGHDRAPRPLLQPVVADGFGGAVVREAPVSALAGARRKALTIAFGRLAALRASVG